MKITFYGHSSFSVKTGETILLFDPFISANPKAAHIDINKLEADYILLSHAHQDHILDAMAIAKRTGATIVSNYEITTWYEKQGHKKTHPLNHGGSWNFDFGRVKYVNAIHTSSFPDGSYGGNPGGFIVFLKEGKTFYYSGDTALTMDMKLYADDQPGLAILPIGDNFTMGVADAVKCADMVNVKEVMGVHYDTFGYIMVDHADAKAKFAAAGKNLHLPGIGESLEF
ncbi:MAG: metal-dependent hydrolase [Bacteroidia bacterium]|nr:metal-dependent hydrolase [Bacteroidia bacterium]